MPIIDSDAHVIETERTWQHMSADEQDHRPLVVVPKADQVADVSGGFPGRRSYISEYWLIEGRAIPKRSNFHDPLVDLDAAEATDVARRLAHMDELGVDVHVLYPTIFVQPVTRRPEVELALYRSYNRWMKEVYDAGSGRLRYAAMVPYMTMDAALAEMRWAKANGACAIFMHSVEGERRLSEPYFDPVYREAADLDLAVCVHATSGNFSQYDLYLADAGFSTFKLPVVGAFHDLLMQQVPTKHPDVRWGFLEVSSQWVPYALNDMALRFEKAGWPWPGRDVLRESNMFVACQTADDLDWVLDAVGDDNIVIGSDYGHSDTSSELRALSVLEQSGKVPPASASKILEHNARRLYGL